MIFGFHHRRKRKLIALLHTDSKSSHLEELFDKLAYAAGVLMAFMTAPQIWKIFSTQNAVGVSVVTWTMYGVGSCFWIIYGIVNKERPIIFTNSVAAAMQFSVVLGALLYS